jgi:hypothetical protein
MMKGLEPPRAPGQGPGVEGRVIPVGLGVTQDEEGLQTCPTSLGAAASTVEQPSTSNHRPTEAEGSSSRYERSSLIVSTNKRFSVERLGGLLGGVLVLLAPAGSYGSKVDAPACRRAADFRRLSGVRATNGTLYQRCADLEVIVEDPVMMRCRRPVR